VKIAPILPKTVTCRCVECRPVKQIYGEDLAFSFRNAQRVYQKVDADVTHLTGIDAEDADDLTRSAAFV
jgi:hypothetical protein